MQTWQSNQTIQCFFAVADLHAFTTTKDPRLMLERSYDLIAWFIATGCHDNKNAIFIQSQVSQHTQCVAGSCLTHMGELSMTQYKVSPTTR